MQKLKDEIASSQNSAAKLQEQADAAAKKKEEEVDALRVKLEDAANEARAEAKAEVERAQQAAEAKEAEMAALQEKLDEQLKRQEQQQADAEKRLEALSGDKSASEEEMQKLKDDIAASQDSAAEQEKHEAATAKAPSAQDRPAPTTGFYKKNDSSSVASPPRERVLPVYCVRSTRSVYSSVRNKGDCPELHLSGISAHFSGRPISISAGRETGVFGPQGASTPSFGAGRPGKWDEIRAGLALKAT